MSETAFAYCEGLVRHMDRDRYLATLLAPAPQRPPLFALYAFNHEVAKIAETVTQPIAGQIRLQWWRDAIDGIYAGSERQHEVVQALARAVRAHNLPRALVDQLIDARENDLDPAPFANLPALEAYCDATSGHLMGLAARILGAGEALDSLAGKAGTAYALAGLLRAIPFHAARGRAMLPSDKAPAILSGECGPPLIALMTELAAKARVIYGTLRHMPIARTHLPALLPAALVPLYLKSIMRPGFDPFRHATDIPAYRRQLAMLGAMLRGRL